MFWDGWNCTCKGPVAEEILLCVRLGEEARVAGTQREQGQYGAQCSWPHSLEGQFKDLVSISIERGNFSRVERFFFPYLFLRDR